jgi:colanic acid/amylovoran biosynthesis glycosyltransferase
LFTLEAFRLARQRRPHLVLNLIGDGPLANDVEHFVRAHKLTSAVRLCGQLDHQRTLGMIRGSDLLLHHAVTSPEDGDAEGQPVVILEAMAAGLAVITTRHAGIPEIVEHDRSGRLVDEGDVAAMAEQIVDTADDPAGRARLGGTARRAIATAHTTEHARRRICDLLGLPAIDGSAP